MPIKGLDNWIMGVNDPNAPFNLESWAESFECVLEHCTFISEEWFDKMCSDDDVYTFLGILMSKVAESFYDEDTYYSQKENYEHLKANAKEIAVKFESEVLDFCNQKNNHIVKFDIEYHNKSNVYRCPFCGFEKLCNTIQEAKNHHDKYMLEQNRMRKIIKNIIETK